MHYKETALKQGDIVMNVLHICTFYHRAMIFYDSITALGKIGVNSNVFNAVAKGTVIDDEYKGIMDDRVIHTECFNKLDRYLFFYKQRKIYNAICRETNISAYDLIHSHTLFNGGYAAYRLKKRFGIPYVISVRDTDVNYFLKIPFLKIVANRIIQESSGIQFLSKPYKDDFILKYLDRKLLNDFQDKSVIIGNGVESFWLQNKNTSKQLHQNVVKALYTGRINANKNMGTTLAALDIIKNQGYSICFTVAGKIESKRVFRMLEKSENTKVLRHMKKEELLHVFREHDIFIMPSIKETFGRVYAEAISQGLPVIYSKGQGFDGNFDDGVVGYAVPSRDSGYIADCIIKILNDYEKISERCIEKSVIFDWDDIAANLKYLYIGSIERSRQRVLHNTTSALHDSKT